MQQPFRQGGQGQMPGQSMMGQNPQQFQPMMSGGQQMPGTFPTQPGMMGPNMGMQGQMQQGNFPGNMQRFPGSMQPGNMQHMQRMQPGMQQVPVNVQQIPGNMQQRPGNMQQVRGNMQHMPGNMQQMPGNMQQMPENMQQMPGNVQQIPGNMQQMPGMPGMPGNMQQMPGNMQQMPGNMQQMPGNMQPGMQFMPGGGGVGMRGPAPPPYDPQMAKEFKVKQEELQRKQMRQMEKQRQKMEQEMKQRQFQETQKRLKEFSSMGGRKMDVDSAIHSIIGSSAHDARAHAQRQQPVYMHSTGQPSILATQSGQIPSHTPYQQAPPTMDNDFADFKGAPVNQTSSANQSSGDDFADFKSAPVHQILSTSQNAGDDFADFKSGPNAPDSQPAGGAPANQMSGQNVKPAEKKKDLDSMMNQLDLSAAGGERKQLKFKPSVKDVHRESVKADSFRVSERARHWSYAEQENLSQLFTLPEQQSQQSPNAQHQPSLIATSPPKHVSQPVPSQHVQGQPVPSQHVQGQPVPGSGQHLPPQHVPSQHVQGQPVPANGQHLPPQHVPSQHVQGQPVPGSGQHLPPQHVPSQHVQGQPVPGSGQHLPPQHVPSQHVQGQPVPANGQHLPPQHVPGHHVPVGGQHVPVSSQHGQISPGAGQHVPVSTHVPGAHVPAGVPPARWFEEGVTCPMPDVYMMVLEACTRDKKIDTSLVYPILLRSGLEKAVLGQLWALCNTLTPGQLARHELWRLLAMVAVAQNKMKHDSLDILQHCPYPPIPQLGQSAAPPPPAPAPSQQAPASTAPTSAQVAVPQASTPVTSLPPGPVSQQAPPISPANQTISTSHQEEFADFQAFQDEKDDFADFKQAPPTLPMAASASDLIGDDKYAALRVDVPDTDKTEKTRSIETTEEFADFASFSDDTGSNSDAKMAADFSSVTSNDSSKPQSVFSSSHDDDSWSGFSGVTDSQSNKPNIGIIFDVKPPPQAGNKLDLFKKPLEDAKDRKDGDDFGGFVSKPVTIGPPKGDDKLSAIKALIMDQTLFSEKPVEVKSPDSGIKADDNDKSKDKNDWEPFASSNNSTIITSQSEPNSFMTSEKATNEEEGWADFAAAPSASEKKDGGFADFQTFDQASGSDKDSKGDAHKKGAEPRLQVDPAKANSMFSHNLPHARSQPMAMSALDTEPPEIPDFPDDDGSDHHHHSTFDKFGTFQGHAEFDLDTQSSGISSLVTPYGGFDDAMEPSANKAGTSSNMTNSLSASSYEFTGWRNQSKTLKEDSQSMKSLELKNTADSQDGSPNNADSQSVASLDLSAEHKKKSASDAKSVASLELPASAESEDTKEQAEMQVDKQVDKIQTKGFPEPGHVKAGSELLSQGGEAPTFGDRYSALFDNQPQDSEKHIYAWEKCLVQSQVTIKQANQILNNIHSMEVLKEVMESEKGSEYIQSVTEIYRVSCRIKTAMQGLSLNTSRLDELQRDVHNSWNNLVSFMSATQLMPSAQSLSFKKALRKDKSEDNITNILCGVCLLDASVANDDGSANEKAEHKLSYGGRDYHITCANFWVNCVDSMLPALKIPELI